MKGDDDIVLIGDGLRKKAIWENFCEFDKYKKIKYKAQNTK